jgi:hypothetical protein
MASISRRTYDTDSIVLRRIFAVNPTTNDQVSSGYLLATTANNGAAQFLEPLSFFSTIGFPNSSATSTFQNVGASTVTTSTLVLRDNTLQTYSFLRADNGTLLFDGVPIGGGGGSITLNNLTSTVTGLNNQTASTVTGLATASYISSPSLQSTLRGIGTLGYLSSASGLISSPQLLSTVAGLGSAGFLSTFQSSFKQLFGSSIMLSTIQFRDEQLGTAGILELSNTKLYLNGVEIGTGGGGGDVTRANLVSTVDGLGTFGYLSTLQSSFKELFGSSITLSTIQFRDEQTGAAGILELSNAKLYLNGVEIGTGGGGGLTAANLASTVTGLATAGYLSSASNLVSTPYLTSNVQSTVTGLATAGYLSSASNLVSTAYLTSNIQSTLIGLGSLGYLSSASNLVSTAYLTSNVQSTVTGLATAGYLSTASNLVSTPYLTSNVQSTVTGLATAGYLSSASNLVSTPYLTSNIQSTIAGLATIGYLSSANGLISTGSLTSTVTGLATAGYLSSAIGLISTPNLISTINGLGTMNYISSAQLTSTVAGISKVVSSVYNISTVSSIIISSPVANVYLDNRNATIGTLINNNITINTQGGSVYDTDLVSSNKGLGTIGYLSTANLLSSVAGLATYGYISTPSLLSSVTGLATVGYLSTVPSTFISTAALQSSIAGLGSLGYLSTVPSTFISTAALQSSLTGLGSLGYLSTFVSSLNQLFTSSVQVSSILFRDGTLSNYSILNVNNGNLLLNGATIQGGSVMPADLTSTTRGLGTLGYLSSVPSTFVSSATLTSTVEAALTSTVSGLGSLNYISTFVSSLNQLFTSSIQVSSILFRDGTLSNYSILNVNNGSLLLNGAAIQGGGVVAADLTSTVLGLGTRGYLSSVPSTFISTAALTSTVLGLGTFRYLSSVPSTFISTAALTSTVAGLGRIYVSTLSTFSTSIGSSFYTQLFTTPTATINLLNVSTISFGVGSGFIAFTNLRANYISSVSIQTTNLWVTSTLYTNAISSAEGFFSSLTGNGSNLTGLSTGLDLALRSTTQGLATSGYLSSANGLISTGSLASTVTGLATAGYLSSASNLVSTPYLTSNVQSTVTGLATAGYLSSASNLVSTAYLTSNIQSTIAGLATVGYLSSAQGLISTAELASTVRGLGSANYISSAQLVSTTFGITSNYSTFLSTTLATYLFPYSGETLYLNYSISVPPYKQLGVNNIIGPSVSDVFTVPLNSIDNLVTNAVFQSDFYMPTFIATGIWNVNLFCEANATGVSIYASLYQRTPGGTETLIATSSNSPFIVPLTKVELSMTVDVPYVEIPVGNTLVMKFFANNSANQARTLTTYYENGNYSHVHTTLGTTVLNTSVYSTVTGLGTAGYVSSTQLTSTVAGLGSAGYVSSIQLLNTIAGLGSLGYVSSTQLRSTVAGLGTLGYVSSTQLTSTVAGLATSGYLSSANGLISTASLTSTVAGLGSAGYVSSLVGFASTVGNFLRTSTGSLTASSIVLMDPNGAFFGIDWMQMRANFAGVFLEANRGQQASFRTSNVTVSTLGLQDLQLGGNPTNLYQSNATLYFGATAITSGSAVTQPNLISTIDGLGTLQYLSGPEVSVSKLAVYDTFTATNLAYSYSNFYSHKTILSTLSFYNTTPRTAGMVVANDIYTMFLSSADLFYGPNNTFPTFLPAETYHVVTDPNVTSTTRGLANIGYLSSFTSTTSQLFTSSAQVSTISFRDGTLSNYSYLNVDNGSLLLNGSPIGGGGVTTPQLASTIEGLGTYKYISTVPQSTTFFSVGQAYIGSLTVPSVSTGGIIFSTARDFLTASTNTLTQKTNLFVNGLTVGSYSPVRLTVTTLGASANLTTAETDIGKYYLITTTSGNNVNFPTADPSLNGWYVVIKNADGSPDNLTVNTTSVVSLYPGVTTTVICDGTSYYSF